MKLPSLQYLFDQTLLSFRRYPMVLISASIASATAVYLNEFGRDLDNTFPYINLLLCGYLGVPMFLSVDTYCFSSQKSPLIRMLMNAVVVGLLVLLWFYLPNREDSLNEAISYIRYTVYAVAAHLLVSFAAYLSRGTLNGFWQFNKALFLRFFLASLYSFVVYLGLAMAMLALDTLFKVSIKEERYLQLFFFIAGVFNTWFFVSGFPQSFSALDKDELFPKGLKTFVLYVLMPLLALYFLILYSYSVKIILLWNWPSGVITYMIIAVAVLGILTVLLAYPYSIREEAGAFRFLNRTYYWFLVPMILMLALAIGIRVVDYGVTINRYITILLTIWLAAVALYMIVSGKNLRVIPVSLFCIILLCSFGFWGVFEVSEKSQVRRLEKVLQDAGILEEKVRNEPVWEKSDTIRLTLTNEKANNNILSDSLHNEVYSILKYLEDYHGLKSIEGWFEQSVMEIADVHHISENLVAMRLMGLQSTRKYKRDKTIYAYPSFYSNHGHGKIRQIKGFDNAWRFEYYDRRPLEGFSKLDTIKVSTPIKVVFEESQMQISPIAVAGEPLNIDLNAFYLNLRGEAEAETGGRNFGSKYLHQIYLERQNDWLKVRFDIQNISADSIGVTNFRGDLFFSLLK
jgi:hypothetical protein